MTRVNDEFARYFRSLGYDVTTDGKLMTGERWHEIRDNGALICQVAFGTPLAEFLADLPYLVDGKPGIGPTNYWCAAKDDDEDNLRELLARVRSARETVQ